MLDTKAHDIAGAPLIVPTLFVPPYRLRPFEMADLDLVREASGDPYIPKITSVPAVYSETEGIAFIERQWSRARLGHGYPFVIADAATDRGVGVIGLRNVDEGRVSIGYWIVKPARGRGTAARLSSRRPAPGRGPRRHGALRCAHVFATPERSPTPDPELRSVVRKDVGGLRGLLQDPHPFVDRPHRPAHLGQRT